MLKRKPCRPSIGRERGTSMIEVLVSIVIVVLGLLGLAGLQSHASLAEMEAFQRAQALVLLQDMVDRINANRKNAKEYANGAVQGTGKGVDDCSGKATVHERDLCEWSNGLLGASESAGGIKAGAMIDARGCVVMTAPNMPRQFVVSVVWQGLTPTAQNNATQCGAGLYGNENVRRAVTTTVTIGCLQNDPASGICITP